MTPRPATARPIEPVARLALSIEEAAASLGVSRDTFDRAIRDDVRLVRVGSRLLVPVAELERWLDRNAARILDDLR